MISGLSNPKLPININLLRNYLRFEPSDLTLDFYTLDTSRPIKIKASNDEVREFMISLSESAASRIDLLGNENNISSTDTKNRYGLVLKCKTNGHPVESSITLSHKGVENNDYEQSVKYDSDYKEKIDEISNGFHYSVMKALWRTILLASKKNNVQLFATSHDLDSIKGLRDAALHDEGDKVAFFKLQRTADAELKSYCYTTDSIYYMLNQEIEVR